MDKVSLKQLCGLRYELDALEDELAEARKQAKRREYIFGAYRLIGDGLDDVREVETALLRKHEEYNAVLEGCKDFIDAIPEADIRAIFHRRYILGQKWLPIAFAVGASCESTPRNRHDRYLRRAAGE